MPQTKRKIAGGAVRKKKPLPARNPIEIAGRTRVVIERVFPEIDGGKFAVRRVPGEQVVVEADVFCDGHDEVRAVLLYRKQAEKDWIRLPMRSLGNDRYRGSFVTAERCAYFYTVEAWVDVFASWQRDVGKKLEAGQDVSMDMRVGSELIQQAAARANGIDRKRLRECSGYVQGLNVPEALSLALSPDLRILMALYPEPYAVVRYYNKELKVEVDRGRAACSAWYEFFPRNWGSTPAKQGMFRDCERILPEIRRMGFDVVYLPPIHPIGKTKRKGKNNNSVCQPNEPGSPWAIGSARGGHMAIHPELGTAADFTRFVNQAKKLRMEIALDIAFQCSPDHPYVKQHPQWFKKRPDGTIQCAENPPKKYEDVVPFNFETQDWQALWLELKEIFLFWIKKGINIFRVDNPHTKPIAFWEWLIQDIKREYPDVLFLAEAFTRPKVMYRLAKIGFTQSYTYFTWRTTKQELTEYLTELTQTQVGEYFRPNFWPNTPDILPQHLQYGGRPMFISRLILAATLSSNYGIYGPAFELCTAEALPDKEEYLDSDKYEIKQWDWDTTGNLKDLIARVNKIRGENSALQRTRNLRFLEIDNEALIAYVKTTEEKDNIIVIVVCLDPYHPQGGWLRLPLAELDIDPAQTYRVKDLISDDKYIWQGERNYVQLDPASMPAHILRIQQRVRREKDFDYFM